MPKIGSTLNADYIVEAYQSGQSEKRIADEFGVSRNVIGKILSKRNVVRRGIGDATRLFVRLNHTPERGQAITRAAHIAVCGSRRTPEDLAKRAKGCEQKRSSASPAENELAAMLRNSGLEITQQKAVGSYNLDIAINKPPIAVEVFDGGWHLSGNHIARFFDRSKYILDSGWSLVIVWLRKSNPRNYTPEWRITTEARDYLVAFSEVLRNNPSLRSQYRVINGNGELLTGCKSYLFDNATIQRLTGGN